jgi:3-hydroxy-5-methyl-1-naphthoate 3-O-methyltransferase
MSEAPSPAALLALGTAWQRAKVLFALIELRIPALLAGGPRGAGDVAAQLDADPVAAGVFLEACVALGLLVRDGEGFRNAPATERFLVPGTPTYLGDLFARHARMWDARAWREFPARLCAWRAGTARPPSMEGVPVGGERHGQHRLSLLAGEALGRAVDLSTRRCLLDLGGGTAGMSIALCRSFPRLRAVVVEHPAMVDAALAAVRECGVADRIEVCEGDFLTCPLPAGADVVLLSNVLSLSSEAINRALLGRIFDALPAGGLVLLSGWMRDDRACDPLTPLLFCLEDIALGVPDVEHPAATYADWLVAAGFAGVEPSAYLEPFRLVTGRKPASVRSTATSSAPGDAAR